MSFSPTPSLQHSSSTYSTASTSSTDSTELLTPLLAPLSMQSNHARDHVKTAFQSDSIGKDMCEADGNSPLDTCSPGCSTRHNPTLPENCTDAMAQLFGEFRFGSCPSVPLASTPIAELGPFEYPEDSIPGSSKSSVSYTSSTAFRESVHGPYSPSTTSQNELGRRGSTPVGRVQEPGDSIAGKDLLATMSLARRYSIGSPGTPPRKSVSALAPRRSDTSHSPESKLANFRLDMRRGSLPSFSPAAPLSASHAQPLHLTLKSSIDGGHRHLPHGVSFKYSSFSLDAHSDSQLLAECHSNPPALSPSDNSPNQRVHNTVHRERSRGSLHFPIPAGTWTPIPPSLLARREKRG